MILYVHLVFELDFFLLFQLEILEKYQNELKSIFPSLDNFKYKDKWWVINIGGNNLRLIAFIEFRDNRMYVRHITTHTEYDKLCDKYAKESKK